MTRKSRRKSAEPVAPVPPVDQRRKPAGARLLVLGGVALLILGLVIYWLIGKPLPVAVDPEKTAKTATYVGAGVCKSCHEAEFKAWSGSHHDLAMQHANAETVLGDFADARFRHRSVESRFFKRGDKFMVRTDGADGKLADYEIAYTFGVYPLQQYLIPFPGGRYQMLPIAWDARPRAQGGQRWFHLQPDEKIDHRDPLHWTGIYQNWALQCAECHSTDLKKGYDAASDTYRTTYSEINVACEACHGQGSAHVEWARSAKAPYGAGDKGLTALASRWKEAWSFPSKDARFAVRDKPANTAGMNTCAACHARRSTLSEVRKAGAPLEDSHRLAMLTAPNYHADGQQREEVYVWGSFLQSKMHQRGVTCMDCHEPHSLKTRAEGNALCTRCHNAAEFDAPAHHRHVVGGQGAQCVNCHMPTQNYMVIHARQDHSLRVPRPDLSQSLGSPNACNQCHTDKKPAWAASAMDKWHGTAWRERPHYGTTLQAGETRGIQALPALLELAAAPATPAIVRATAATLAQPFASPSTLPATLALLQDGDPSVRIAALGMLAPLDAPTRLQAAAPLLGDPVRGVRIEAANILADLPDSAIPEYRRAERQAALQDYEAALALDADWPAVNVNLGNLRLRQGRPAEAVAAYQRAIRIDPRYVGGYVNLADAWRQQGKDAEAEQVLRQGLATLPQAADLHHALGLLLVRQNKRDAALLELAEGARLAPENAHYAYVYAIALDSAGRRREALVTLRGALQRHPDDLEILGALVSISRDAGDRQAALRYAKQAAALLPGNAELAQLVAALEAR